MVSSLAGFYKLHIAERIKPGSEYDTKPCIMSIYLFCKQDMLPPTPSNATKCKDRIWFYLASTACSTFRPNVYWP